MNNIKAIDDLFDEIKYSSSYPFESNIKEKESVHDWRNYVPSEFKTIIKKDYLAIARNCWDAVKNIHYLPPAVYGMKVSYEHKIKELQMELQRRIDNDTH